jgi:hypothetical protein
MKLYQFAPTHSIRVRRPPPKPRVVFDAATALGQPPWRAARRADLYLEAPRRPGDIELARGALANIVA